MVPWRYPGGSMKKTVKKLKLAKETLRELEKLTLSKLAGGTTDIDQTCPSCPKFCVDEPITYGC
jgi:hypothetical protein